MSCLRPFCLSPITWREIILQSNKETSVCHLFSELTRPLRSASPCCQQMAVYRRSTAPFLLRRGSASWGRSINSVAPRLWWPIWRSSSSIVSDRKWVTLAQVLTNWPAGRGAAGTGALTRTLEFTNFLKYPLCAVNSNWKVIYFWRKMFCTVFRSSTCMCNKELPAECSAQWRHACTCSIFCAC